MASAKTDRVIEEPNTDWKKYGLAPPAVKLSAKLNDGKTYDLELGEKDFTDSSVFRSNFRTKQSSCSSVFFVVQH